MKPRMLRAVLPLLLLGTISCFTVQSAEAVADQLQDLDADNIAQRSLLVASTMKSTGYCYAGVTKALSPLGVTLTGAAAYEARDQLAADMRFMPVSVGDSVELRRGDIIVFDKSAAHQYGHICVYQGNGEESSDHVSRLTTPGAYGGVSVFRLRSDRNEIAGVGERFDWSTKMPLLAPDFRNAISSNAAPAVADHLGRGGTKSAGTTGGATGFVRRQFRILSGSSNSKSLTKSLIRFVVNSL